MWPDFAHGILPLHSAEWSEWTSLSAPVHPECIPCDARACCRIGTSASPNDFFSQLFNIMVQGVKIEAGHIVDVNPATGEEVGRVKCSTEQEVDAAIAAAQKVQPSWAGIGLAERTELVKAAKA